ncbi:hypothetical protein OIO90_000599 [Microbotryomycetes sp. JL221]|nr:hypothetical protein OIO90_000599 [Microbotryomycetes sp. JL221]
MASSPSRSPSPSNHSSTDLESTLDETEHVGRVHRLEQLILANLGTGVNLGLGSASHDLPTTDGGLDGAQRTSSKRTTLERDNPRHPQPVDDPPALRLFSTQSKPEHVVIKTAEEEWPVVKDTRVRDADDEDVHLYQERQRAIATLAIDGQALVRQGLAQPYTKLTALNEQLSRHAYRVTQRKLVNSQMTRIDSNLPRLAFLDAVLSLSRQHNKTSTIQNASNAVTNPSLSRLHDIERRMFQRSQSKRLGPRHPLNQSRPTELRLVAAASGAQSQSNSNNERQANTKSTRPAVSQALTVADRRQMILDKLKRGIIMKPQATLTNSGASTISSIPSATRGNKRLSKKRREELKLKLKKLMGKNSKKNQRKKAKKKEKESLT